MIGVELARVAAVKRASVVEQRAEGLLLVGGLDTLERDAVHVVVALEEDDEKEGLVGEFESGENGMQRVHFDALRNEMECWG